jgi:phospholipid/cholesterol/gamma-HCH transport system substrate-binding protein
VDPDRVRCRVVDGRDPQPADGYDETGSNIRGEQNIGRNGGVGAAGPGGGLPGAGGQAPELSTDLLDDVLGGLLNATPLTRAGG